MKKKLLLGLFLVLSSVAFSQISTQSTPQTFTASILTPVVLPVIGSGTAFYQISWNVIGSLTGCAVEVDSSATGSGGWGAADIIASQTCTSNGTVTSTTHTVNYVRINPTSVTGTGSLVVTLTGYFNNPAGGGSGTVNANNGVANELTLYPAAAGSTTVGPDATLVDNGALLNYTGTQGYEAPNGTTTAPGYSFAAAATLGLSALNANVGEFVSNGSGAGWNGSGLWVSNTGIYCFKSSTGSSACDSVLSRIGAGIVGVGLTAAGQTTGSLQAAKLLSGTNCVTGASCGSASNGFADIAAAATTVTVSTTAVTANSQIILQFDTTIGGASQLNVTCNTGTSTVATYWVSTRTAGTSFVISTNTAPVTNPACVSWMIVN